MSIGDLYVRALDASIPVIFLTAFGFVLSWKTFPADRYQLISVLTFKITMPITMIFTIGRQTITLYDLLFLAAYLLASYSIAILALPQALLYGNYAQGLGHLIAIMDVNNAVFSGVPVCQGMYDAELCYKYGYLSFAFTNAFVLPLIYILLEMASERDSQKLSRSAVVCKAVRSALLSPMVLAVFAGLVYCVVQMFLVPYLGRLPVYFAQLFNYFGDFASNSAMVMLGIFLFTQIKAVQRNRHKALMSKREVVSFVIIVIHRHLTAPILLALYCRLLNVQYEITELTAVIFSGPTAILSFAISDQYQIGAFAAGIEACFGVLVGMLVIPIVQLVVRTLYYLN